MKNKFKYSFLFVLFIQTVFLFGQSLSPNTTGSFVYTPTGPLSSKPITVYYRIPAGDITTMPILFAFHGDERNALDYRDYWISMANANGFMVFAPEFKLADYSAGDGYQMGNVFVDGDNPSLATLNPTNEWTFSVVDPLFETIKTQVSGTQLTYDAWGHSGGAQFLQRFGFYLPNNKMKTAICSNAGWYTVPESAINYPYGLNKSQLLTSNITTAFSKKLIVHLGLDDTDPNSSGLRHNTTVDNQQGLNRLDRGRYFFNTSQSYSQTLNVPFNWQREEVVGVGHDAQLMAANALKFLFKTNANNINSSILDGGFENQTTGYLAGGTGGVLVLSTSSWTTNTTGGNIVRVVNASGGRTGPKCVTFGVTSGNINAKNYYSPQLPGAFLANTKYQIQFFYKTASSGVGSTTSASTTVNLYVDNSAANPAGNIQSVPANLGTAVVGPWTKKTYEITTNATTPSTNGLVGLSITPPNPNTGYSVDFDDYVVYQGELDTTVPSSPGAITATGATGGANVSWAAATSVDGGGYVVVRYTTTTPSASNDPTQNGIYAKGNTIGAGVVRYIGTGTSFSDTGLSPGVDYYYKVYTVDKAFNYSDESVSTAVQSLATTYFYNGTGLLTDLASWGLNPDGKGTAPTDFTLADQVFEIRNATAVALDGAWVVGTTPANGTKVRLGNSTQPAIILTLNSTGSIGPPSTGNFDVMVPVSGNHTVIYKGTTLISFGNIFDTNLEVIYDGVTVSTTSTKNFGTVTIKNGADVSFSAAVTIKNLAIETGSNGTFTLLPIITNITVNGTLITPTTATSYITIPDGGSVIINGTVRVPKLTGFVSSGVTPSSAGGDIQFIGTENLTLGSNSTVEYLRDATSNQNITARTDYKNLTLSGTVPKTISGITTVAGVLTINTGTALNVTSPNLSVTGAIANSGTMTLANNSNLIQGGITNTNTGNITVNRNSNALSRLDYTIWSSPVTNTNQFLKTFSPLTLDTRFYNYNEGTNLYNAITTPSGTPFATTTGYLIRMPDNAVTAPEIQALAVVFTGVPNNGDITKAVTYNGALFGYNMLGNPYPSTLDANAFIAANTTNIESSLYFWRKTNGASGSAYAVYNPLGSTAASPSSSLPNGAIQVGQGFLVKAKSAANITFTNAMRLGTISTQFFKTKQVVQKDRLWLNMTNTKDAFSQALVGYVADASQGVDIYDGKYFNDSPIALTSNINNEEYTIQGRPSFDPSDVVALNFKTDTAGDYTIALDHFDGLFAAGQDVYLKDNTTGTETDLKASAYTFAAAAGTDNARFSLKYQKTLKVNASAFNENSVRVYKNNATLYVNSGTVAISNIKVYDLLGRMIAEQKNVKATAAVINNLKTVHQVLIVKITGEDNNVVTKKVVN
jgi:hypothetical protein